MKVNIFFFLALLSHWHMSPSDCAEYCPHYPGDISFSYSVTQDEDYWLQNYQNAYTTKKGNEDYKVYRRKTTISRVHHPHGHTPNMNNIPIIQQQVQQQQVQIEPEPVINETGIDSGKQMSLPIWKIIIPTQTSKAIVARIENGEVVDHFELNKTHFGNTNMTVTTASTSATSNTLSARSTTTRSGSVRTIDITDQSIIPDSWYMVCLDVNIVLNGNRSVCNHCTLIKSRTDGGHQQFLDIDWESGTMKNDSAELRYSAVDMPFEFAMVTTKVWTKYTHPRCHGTIDHVVYESKDFVHPEHFVYVTVKKLLPWLTYAVQVDLDVPWKTEPNGILPVPFMIQNYLNNDMATTTLERCEDYQKEGD